ncbi:MAG: deoxyribose-phosphate aldolase [Anaerolineales bacterium]|nr:deoxyribose-phosphate aldolase [Anaerolineales bacterium]
MTTVNEPTRALALMIDHTQLNPDATYQQIDALCQEAAEYQFASVCIHPIHAERCTNRLLGTSVQVCTVVGFPLGTNLTSAKVYETQAVIELGATEIDMVMNIGALKSNDLMSVQEDIAAVVQVCHQNSAICKVIIETCLLSDSEKLNACSLVQASGADFVKTSTGFSTGGATVEDVRLMRQTVGPNVGVKAAGGIRTLQAAEAMIEAGANRIGASASVRIMQELLAQ